MANITLLGRDSYQDTVKHGVKVDTVAALRNSPLHMTSLFTKCHISLEEAVAHYKDKQHSGGSHKKSSTTPITPDTPQKPIRNQGSQPGSNLVSMVRVNTIEARPPTTHSD